MCKSKNPIFYLSEELAEQIAQVTEYQIDDLLRLVESHCNRLHPEQECIFLSLSRDSVQREVEITFLVNMLRGH